ncbi:MAG: HD domain-containing protein [Tyzzerella sp.]|uniref:HD domain-containing protein n=1 Tax=Candidatus Fimicola merdigallinarum TaxID=2840819 RepID=A0A9D9DUQ4_9FIRM|nr:HD domain-containing protein [Candidatus Fimicola merdigallinarum]
MTDRFKKQIEFIYEIDKAKNIFRQTYVSSGDRRENDAEHSWHLGLMAIILSEYFEDVDVLKTIKMVLMHDIVEIYAGDTYCYDEKANEDKSERESLSAEKIYGLLPDDQKDEYISLWREFEKRESREAKFALVLDRIQPVILNYATDGRAWREHNIYRDQVENRNKDILSLSNDFSDLLKAILDLSVEKGYLKTR